MDQETARILFLLMGIALIGAAISQGLVVIGQRRANMQTAPSGPQHDAQPKEATQARDAAQPLALAQVLTYLNDKVDDAPHCFVVGSTGAGKSTFAKLLVAPRTQRGEQFVIVTGKRTAAFSGLPCVGRDGVGDYRSVNAMFDALLAELIRRDKTALETRNFPTLTIVIDDATILLAESEIAQMFFRECALIGREVGMRMIVILGSLRVKELGLEGRGDLREHFAIVTYHKTITGNRITSLRPRFDEADDTAFDATPVPHYADRVRIDAAQAWQPEDTPDADRLLAGMGVATTLQPVQRAVTALESDVTEKRYVTNAVATPVEIARIAVQLTNNVPPSEIAKALPGYDPRSYKDFRAKVRYVQELLAAETPV